MYNLMWSQNGLNTPQKLGTFCEYYAKMALTSYGMDVYSSEVDDHGIDFVAETKKGFLKFQVKSIRLAATKYVFMRKDFFETLDDNMYLFLIVLKDGEHPNAYIVPTSAWRINTGSKLFVHHENYKKPEYGVNVSAKNMSELEPYSIDKMITCLF